MHFLHSSWTFLAEKTAKKILRGNVLRTLNSTGCKPQKKQVDLDLKLQNFIYKFEKKLIHTHNHLKGKI
jgi:hypothetical protein